MGYPCAWLGLGEETVSTQRCPTVCHRKPLFELLKIGGVVVDRASEGNAQYNTKLLRSLNIAQVKPAK